MSHEKSKAAMLLVLLTLRVLAESPSSGVPNATERIRAAARAENVAFPFSEPEIRIFKAKHRLELWASGRKIKTYEIALGSSGPADKRRAGDHLTPEGRFFVCSHNAQSEFHLFLGLSYPNEVAADRGYREGLISKGERDAIKAANQHQACPSWNTRLGGTVGIHGGGTGFDWTWGCIALRNSDIEELWAACPNGTPVLIVP